MGGPVIAFISMFADLGVNQATVQRPNLWQAEANAPFWWTVGIGCVLAAIILAILPLVGLSYHDARADISAPPSFR